MRWEKANRGGQAMKNDFLARGQAHLLYGYDELNMTEQANFKESVEKIDWSLLERISSPTSSSDDKKNIEPMDCLTLEQIKKGEAAYLKAGLDLLRKGEVGALMLAGGAGTRLHANQPKGMFNIGLTREISIFSLHMKHLREVSERVGRPIPLFVMTSESNHKTITDYFEKEDWFGYPRTEIFFFMQETNPCISFDGKVLLEDKGKIAVSPNGNGGWFGSMLRVGLDEVLSQKGIRWLNVFAVDNVLQKIADPLFVGATAVTGCEVGGKVVKKAYPTEKAGLVCKMNGKPGIIEYYELDEHLANLRNDRGELVYRFGVILNYLFSVDMLKRSDISSLPLHVVKKAVPYLNEKGEKISPKEPNAYKFETLALDLISLSDSFLPFEVERSKEFAPIKNESGVDSPESARALLIENGFEL